MTPRDRAKAMLMADGWGAADAGRWLDEPGHIATIVQVHRTARAEHLRFHGMVETPQSERAGEMVRTMLAVLPDVARPFEPWRGGISSWRG